MRRYRDARAEARSAAARDAAVVERGRELLALTAGAADGEEAAVGAAEGYHPLAQPAVAPSPRAGSLSPRDHTPASSGALVLRSGRVAPGAGDSLRSLLDYAFSDADFASVLALLAAAGGHAGPAPASAAAIDALPALHLAVAGCDGTACPVCLCDLGAEAPVKAMPCGTVHVPHAFHAHCIERWLRLHNSCPTCRTALAEPPAAAGADAPATGAALAGDAAPEAA